MPFHVVWNIYLPQGMTGSIPTRLLTDETVLSVERTSYDHFFITMIVGVVQLPACIASNRNPTGYLYYINGDARTLIRDPHLFERMMGEQLNAEQPGDSAVVMMAHEVNTETVVDQQTLAAILADDTPPSPALEQLFESSSHGINPAVQQVFGDEPIDPDPGPDEPPTPWPFDPPESEDSELDPAHDAGNFNNILVNAIDYTIPVPLWRDPDPNSDDGAEVTVPAGTLCRLTGGSEQGLATVEVFGWVGTYYTPVMHVHHGWPHHLTRDPRPEPEPVNEESTWPYVITELDPPQVFEMSRPYRGLLPGITFETRRSRLNQSEGNFDFFLEHDGGGMWVPDEATIQRGSYSEINLWYRSRNPSSILTQDLPYHGIGHHEANGVVSIQLENGSQTMWVLRSSLQLIVQVEGSPRILYSEDGNVPYWESGQVFPQGIDRAALSAFIVPSGTLPSGIEVTLAGPLTNEAGTLISYGERVILVPTENVRLLPSFPTRRPQPITRAYVINEENRSAPFWAPADQSNEEPTGWIDCGLHIEVHDSVPGQRSVVHLRDGRAVFMNDTNLAVENSAEPPAPSTFHAGDTVTIHGDIGGGAGVRGWVNENNEVSHTLVPSGTIATVVGPALPTEQTVVQTQGGRHIIFDNVNLVVNNTGRVPRGTPPEGTMTALFNMARGASEKRDFRLITIIHHREPTSEFNKALFTSGHPRFDQDAVVEELSRFVHQTSGARVKLGDWGELSYSYPRIYLRALPGPGSPDRTIYDRLNEDDDT